MEQRFRDYLTKIEISEPIISRIDEIINLYHNISDEAFQKIIVSEFINTDLAHIYESLWLFSDNYIMEAKAFIKINNFDITPYRKQIYYAFIEEENFDFLKGSNNSKILLHLSTTNRIKGEIKGTGANCAYIYDIYKTIVQPNIIK